jgi:DNA-directed DNA polymerase III PolC
VARYSKPCHLSIYKYFFTPGKTFTCTFCYYFYPFANFVVIMYFNCHTCYSFKYGVLTPEALFAEAQRCGVHKIILTDINNTSAYIEMQRICRERAAEYSLEVSAGIEFRRNHELLYIGLAINNSGFEELNRFLSHYNLKQTPLPSEAPRFDNCIIVYPMGKKAPEALYEHEYIGVRPFEVPRLLSSAYHAHTGKMVALHPVTFASKVDFNTHRLLRAIDVNTVLSKLDTSLQAHPGEVMMPVAEIMSWYWQHPRIISNTQRILEMCGVFFEPGGNKNKKIYGSSRAEDHDHLRSKALEGFRLRYQNYNAYGMERLLKELNVIAEREFESYFLISLDIVEYARHRNFAHVGRGSGANSMVAYCLGITEVDPIELDLYFERFLNPYRSSPPDFDIDFSWKDRDEVIAYVLKKYGPDHAILLASFNTFQGRSVLRELGKVFGLPPAEIDALVDHPAQMQEKDDITRLIFRYARRLHDLPQHLSIHAGGLLITELPVYAYTAADLPPKGFPISHFDMYGAEDMGIHKFDILSQRGLGHIKDTVALVKKNRGIEIDINQTAAFKKDPVINRQLAEGKAMGCFYIESPAMRMLLGKLRCDNYITLVAASSIIRPGVARSGMMREYIYRHHNPGKFQYIHPRMEELMRESYGVMVYQEDVIKVAHHFAGLDLAEADILRRGMSGKFRSRTEFQKVEQKFFENCRQKGYPDDITKEVWRQIESFSGYSFSKAHSASYAVESYQSLYLKTYFPIEFMVGVINNFGGFYRTEMYFHEARMAGASIAPPCVNHSEYLTSVCGQTIYTGFIHMKSLEQKIGLRIPEERQNHGMYRSLQDFINRVPIGLEQLNLLIKIGAFRSTGLSVRALLWQARLQFTEGKSLRHSKSLFDNPAGDYTLPEFERHPLDDAFYQLEILGFPLCDPFLLLSNASDDEIPAAQLKAFQGKKVNITGYLVTTKNTHTKDHKLMHFGTFTDRQGLYFDTTHFPNICHTFPFRGKGFYRIEGKVVEDFGYPMIEVLNMQKLPMCGRKSPDEPGAPALKAQ